MHSTYAYSRGIDWWLNLNCRNAFRSTSRKRHTSLPIVARWRRALRTRRFMVGVASHQWGYPRIATR
jgi:hypothetical protein